MFKEFFVKRQLKGMGVKGPELDAMMKVVKSNPGLFQRLGQEIEDKVKKDHLSYEEAAMAIATKHGPELAKILSEKS
ncbi:MAG: hypothetical protein WC385_02700 [Candidatus Paceibacterota bacterium]|jgi:hypothetical protein